jgi:hypothetical protein
MQQVYEKRKVELIEENKLDLIEEKELNKNNISTLIEQELEALRIKAENRKKTVIEILFDTDYSQKITK